MSYGCSVCGDEGKAEYIESRRLRLCPSCLKRTPAKVNRDTFERVYWYGKAEEVHPSIRREFYDDYLHSTHNLREYCYSTTDAADEATIEALLAVDAEDSDPIASAGLEPLAFEYDSERFDGMA